MIKYLPNTQKVIGNSLRAQNNNGFTINLLKRYKGNNTIRTQAIKRMKDGSYIEQICMDYGNGSFAALTTRNNAKNPFLSIVFKRDGKVAARCIQSGDSFVCEKTIRISEAKNRVVDKKFEYRKNEGSSGYVKENGKFISDRLENYSIEYLIDDMLRHFKTLG